MSTGTTQRKQFPEGGKPYPIPLPPEGDHPRGQEQPAAFNSKPYESPGDSWFPEGGQPYPLPLPPEGEEHDMNDEDVLDAYGGLNKQKDGQGPIKKKNLIRPKPGMYTHRERGKEGKR